MTCDCNGILNTKWSMRKIQKGGQRMYCTKCGAEVKPGSVYCPNCGAKMKQNAPKKLFVFGCTGRNLGVRFI